MNNYEFGLKRKYDKCKLIIDIAKITTLNIKKDSSKEYKLEKNHFFILIYSSKRN